MFNDIHNLDLTIFRKVIYMGYWCFIVLTFLIFAAAIIFFCYRKIKKQETNVDIIICACVFGLTFFIFGIDIPSALSGGEKVYVEKFPHIEKLQFTVMLNVDGELLFSFRDYDPEKYEQDAEYCITYTKFTKSVLNIEKLEDNFG